MCIVVDSCALPKVFRSSDKNHKKFSSVCNWIVNGDGVFVYGGTKFKAELAGDHKWFVKFLRLLQDHGKAICADTKKVDDRQVKVQTLVTDPDFDDPHLIALIGVTGCKLVATSDKRAEKFLLDKGLYPKGVSVPAIFKDSAKHAAMLTANNIGKCCCTSTRLNKKSRQQLGLPTI